MNNISEVIIMHEFQSELYDITGKYLGYWLILLDSNRYFCIYPVNTKKKQERRDTDASST